MNGLNTFSNECWGNCNQVCPSCGGADTQYNMMEVLCSSPPQYRFRCKCGHHWSGRFNSDLEPTLIPSHTPVPDYTSGLRGWICPVCGAGVSPYQDHCPCCSGKSLTPTWTYTGGLTGNVGGACEGKQSTTNTCETSTFKPKNIGDYIKNSAPKGVNKNDKA